MGNILFYAKFMNNHEMADSLSCLLPMCLCGIHTPSGLLKTKPTTSCLIYSNVTVWKTDRCGKTQSATNINSDSTEYTLVMRTFCQHHIVNSAMYCLIDLLTPSRHLPTKDCELLNSSVTGHMWNRCFWNSVVSLNHKPIHASFILFFSVNSLILLPV